MCTRSTRGSSKSLAVRGHHRCYLPLIDVLRSRAGLRPGAGSTLSLSPTLVAMLGDPLLQARYRDYLGRRARLCEAEVNRHRDEPRLRALAQGYRDDLRRLAALYLDCLGGDLVRAFADLEAAGLVELMTTAATHGYLPLLRTRPEAVRAQLRVGQTPSRRLRPSEPGPLAPQSAAITEGLEAGSPPLRLRLSSWIPTILGARPRPHMGVKPAGGGGVRVACFGRDPARPGRSVADRGISGSPGLPRVPQRHRSVPRPWPAGDFLPHGVAAAPTGIKYHRVTGGTCPKDLYDPAAGASRAEADAAIFLTRRRVALSRSSTGGHPAVPGLPL